MPALNFLTVSRTRITIARLMQPEPPQFIDPLRLAGQDAQIDGCLPISQLSRLCDALLDDSGEIEYTLEFGRDAAGIHCIIGNLSAAVRMACQRCLQPVMIELRGDIRLGIVQGEEEARRLASEYEPLMAGREPMRLVELIEDETLLLLPMVPLHEDTECAGDSVRASSAATKTRANTYKPFSGLEDFKRHGK
ncbi:MAG: YceD family protein [Gammaproteobacteria bacterium]|nr:YceD family protein [Gammaproteobacteria bacterium]